MKENLINLAEEKDEWYLMKAGIDKYECPQTPESPQHGELLTAETLASLGAKAMRCVGLRGWE